MRENSGNGDGGNDSRDPTLRDNAGTFPAGTGGGAPGAEGVDDVEVAADHDMPGGERSPSARKRGEITDTDQIEPTNS